MHCEIKVLQNHYEAFSLKTSHLQKVVKIMKLISMTAFVLQFDKPVGYFEDQSDFLNCQVDYMSKVMNYAQFLKQPLNLGMFFPCDEDGDILDEPRDYEQRLPNMMTEYNDEVYRYKQAKEKVLFKGFDLNQKDLSKLENIFCLTKEYFQISFFTKEKGCFMDNLKTNKTYEIKTIEDLIQFELELTESAIKQTGLWKTEKLS